MRVRGVVVVVGVGPVGGVRALRPGKPKLFRQAPFGGDELRHLGWLHRPVRLVQLRHSGPQRQQLVGVRGRRVRRTVRLP